MKLEKTQRALVLSLALILILTFAMATPLAAMAEPAKKREVEKVVFIHYKAGNKPDWAGPKPKEPKEEDGYKLLRGGVKWAVLPVSYVINTDGSGLDAVLIVAEITEAFEAWDDATSEELFNAPGTTDESGAVRNGVNVVSWVPIEDEYVIAVATIWFYVNTKEMVEFDIVFNSLLTWGVDLDDEGTGDVLTGAFDVENIATHESGHALVLLDLYQDQYSEMTMYGYSEPSEVKKISLEPGDIAGCQRLYGD